MKKFKKMLLCCLLFFLISNLLFVCVNAKGNDVGRVTASVLNLRSGPGMTFKIVRSIPNGNELEIISSYQDWYRVVTSDGDAGWVKSQYISVLNDLTSRGDTGIPAIVEYSERFLGTPYVWGGNTPDGFDCSGFVKYVYKKFGMDLNRVAADQALQGDWINNSDLMPGDLVFFDTNGGHNYINHVGMYIGDGKFIQASSAAGEVLISDMSKGFYADAFMTARRLIN